MSRTATWTSLLAQIRQCADIENSTDRFPDSELLEYANGSWAELYELIILGGGEQYLASGTFSTTSGTATYALSTPTSSTFYKLKGFDINVGAPAPLTLRQFAWDERNAYAYADGWTLNRPVAYRLVNDSVTFVPTPTATYTVTVWYYPAPVKMTAGSDTIDGVAGWEEYVVVDAAIKCLRKDDRDPSVLLAQKAALQKRIIDAAALRNAAEPERVGDVDGSGYGMWWR